MNIRRSLAVAVLAGLAAPVIVAAQDLIPRAAPGFSMTIQSQRQGVFPGSPGTKGGTISGLRFSYLVTSPRDAASGLPTGKRRHTAVVFTKTVGVASTQIFTAMTSNENLPSVVINVPGGEGGYRIKLTNANLSEVKQYTEVINGVTAVLEDVSFTFQKIEVQDIGTGTVAADDWAAPTM